MFLILIFSIFFTFNSLAYDPFLGDLNCGQQGQKACSIRSKEFWAKGIKFCDRGLKRIKKTCTNRKRNLIKDQWLADSLKFQRELLKDRPYLSQPLLFAHNSYNNKADRYFLPNQYYSLTDQLEMGVRVVEWDVHFVNKALRLCHGTDKHLGCSRHDRPFYAVVEELSQWIRKKENKDEIVVLFIQEEFEGKHTVKAKQAFVKPMKQFLGDLVASSHQSNLSANELRTMGKRIILKSSLTDRIVRDDSGFITVPVNRSDITAKPKKFKKLRRPKGPLTKLFLNNDGYVKTPEQVKMFFLKNNPGPLKFDYITPHLAAMAVWSWDKGQPQWDDNKLCTTINQSGRWESSRCDIAKPFSCHLNDQWFVTEAKGDIYRGQSICSQEYPGSKFSFPKDGFQNQKISKKGGEVFISYRKL